MAFIVISHQALLHSHDSYLPSLFLQSQEAGAGQPQPQSLPDQLALPRNKVTEAKDLSNHSPDLAIQIWLLPGHERLHVFHLTLRVPLPGTIDTLNVKVPQHPRKY